MGKENKQFEIEIKARVVDKEKLLAKLKEIAVFKKKYFKKDFYYAKSSDIKSNTINIKSNTINIKDLIRLRLEKGSYTFCSKVRSIINSTEINDERELKVSKKTSREIIKFLQAILDYKLLIIKEKKGRSFKYNNALIEVSTVKNLGDFIEIELLENNGDIDIESKISILKNILFELSLKETDIETKPYISLFLKSE